MKWEDRLDISGLSDVGMRRSNNQDSFRTLPATNPEQWRSRGHFFVVADGMGAHAVGELASKLAVDTIPHTYHKLVQLPCDKAIAKSFQDANTLIHARGTANRDFQGMGTTSTALLLLPEGALIAHVGDSRAYRVRDGRIEQLSFDHSLAWELVRRRQLTLEQARTMVPNNVITRSLGPEPDVEVDLEGPYPVQQGDIFVLCSDGLSGQVSDPEIGSLARYLPPQEACQYLVDMANLRGGPDNITVVIVRVGNPPSDDGKSSEPQQSSLPGTPRDYSTLCLILGAVSLVGCLVLGLAGYLIFGAFGAAGFGFLAGAGLEGLMLLLVGIIWQLYARVQAEPPVPVEANTYRHASCSLDAAMLTRFSTKVQQLQAVAVEQSWNADWSEFFAHRSRAEKLMKTNDRVTALKEFCLALHQLALAQRRHKEQVHELLEGS